MITTRNRAKKNRKFNSNNDNATGITESELTPLEIYPNPTSDYFSINLPDNSNSELLEVYDLMGNLIHQEQLQKANIISVYDWSAGTYILKTESGRVAKLVKH